MKNQNTILIKKLQKYQPYKYLISEKILPAGQNQVI